MLFVGIDQHKRHLTICVRDEQGEIALRRQVSTKWEEVDRFLASLQERGVEHGGYITVMEVRGFNGWLIKRLTQWGYRNRGRTPPWRWWRTSDRSSGFPTLGA